MATLLQHVKANVSGCFRPVSWWTLSVLLVSLIFIFINVCWLPPVLAAAQPGVVTKQVTAVFSGLRLNRATGTFDSVATLKNNSTDPVPGPLSLVITGITPSSVTLANATGTLSGVPYLDVPVANNILEAGATITAVLRFNNPSRVSFTFNHQVTQDPQGVLNYILNSDQVSQEDKQALQIIYAKYQANDLTGALDLLESHFAGPIEEYFNAYTFDSNGNKIPFEIPDTAKLVDTPKEYYNILTTAGAADGYYKYVFDPLSPPPPYLPNVNVVDITHATGFDDIALVDEKLNPITASDVKRFAYGHYVLENGQGMTKSVYKRVSGGGYAPNILGSDAHNYSGGLNFYEWRNLVISKTGLYCDIIGAVISGGSGGYVFYNFETHSGADPNKKYTDLFQLDDCISYQSVAIPLFMVLSQSDDTRDFASIITRKPPKKAVIYTHGTLLFNWGVPFPISLIIAETQSANKRLLDNGFTNVKHTFEEYGFAVDNFYELRWNGGNKTYYRSHAAQKLKSLIYTISARNLYNLNATEIYLVSQSHGTSVSNLAINAIDARDLQLLYGEIVKLISFAGVARQEYIQSKVKQINYNYPDPWQGDGIAPRAWNDYFPFGDPEDDPYVWLSFDPILRMLSSFIYFISASACTDSRPDDPLYYFGDKSPIAVDVDVRNIIPSYHFVVNWWEKDKGYRRNHEEMIVDYNYSRPITWDALNR
ncbi:MAG: hypothetical protein RKP73_07770 [Candidatus Contendobacter sp.]|nr:hypothetical protein [Candidatus Contendobacter sp.]